MSKKKIKIDKTTKHVIEAFSEVLKKNDDGTYKIKAKGKGKKVIRKFKRSCMHWRLSKGRPIPMLEPSRSNPGHWFCKGCHKEIPIYDPENEDQAQAIIEEFEGIVNQMCVYAVPMGGDSDDTKMLIEFKNMIPAFTKMRTNIIDALTKRKRLDDQTNGIGRKTLFDDYNSTHGYR